MAIGATLKAIYRGLLYKLNHITRRELLILIGCIVVMMFIRRPISNFLYTNIPFICAFLMALILGHIISRCYYRFVNNTPLLKDPKLETYIICDIVKIINPVVQVFFPTRLLTLSRTMEICIAVTVRHRTGSDDPLMRSINANFDLAPSNRRKMLEQAQQLEKLGGAMSKDGSDPKHMPLSHVFNEHYREEARRARSDYIKATFLARDADVWKQAQDTRLKVHNPYLFDAYGPSSNTNMIDARYA